MTGHNRDLTVDLAKVVSLIGYRVRYRACEWVECLLLGPQESFLGRGDDDQEALANALNEALPSYLGSRLLELALASQPSAPPEDCHDDARQTAPAAAPTENDTAAEPEARAPVLTARALTQDEVRAYLSAHAKQPAPPRAQRADPHEVLRGLLDRIGSPPDLSTDVGVIEELEHLERLSLPAEIGKWELLTPEMQQLWLSYYVARLRSAKERNRCMNPTSAVARARARTPGCRDIERRKSERESFKRGVQAVTARFVSRRQTASHSTA